MEYRPLGKTGLKVSALGFGCGNVGGLMIRGTPADRERAVARAIELGINYFDTAPSYGDGVSERHLGQALKTVRGSVYVGTKFRLGPEEMRDVRKAITRSVETSLERLGVESVDLLQLHNHIGARGHGDAVGVEDLLAEIVPVMETLRQQGKTRFCGITALGEADALHQVIAAGVLDTAQICYNLLNPSAGFQMPPGFPAQDFGRLLSRAQEQRAGVIAIRVLAAGALRGVVTRHPIALPTVEPIASGPNYAADVGRAQRLHALVKEGHVESLIEASLRFVLTTGAVSTVLVGYSSLDHLEVAARYVSRGPLGPSAVERLSALWKEFVHK